MKKLIIIALGILCATAIAVQAEDAAPVKSKKELAAEKKAVMAELLVKYDADKSGRLNKAEKAAMTPEDTAKLANITTTKKAKTDAPATEAGK